MLDYFVALHGRALSFHAVLEMAHLTRKIFHHPNHNAIPYLDNLNFLIQYPLVNGPSLFNTAPYYPFFIFYSYTLLLLL